MCEHWACYCFHIIIILCHVRLFMICFYHDRLIESKQRGTIGRNLTSAYRMRIILLLLFSEKGGVHGSKLNQKSVIVNAYNTTFGFFSLIVLSWIDIALFPNCLLFLSRPCSLLPTLTTFQRAATSPNVRSNIDLKKSLWCLFLVHLENCSIDWYYIVFLYFIWLLLLLYRWVCI